MKTLCKAAILISSLGVISTGHALDVNILNESESFSRISVDSLGRPYVAGKSTGTISRVAVAAATASGVLRWSRVIDTDPAGVADPLLSRVIGNTLTVGWRGNFGLPSTTGQYGCLRLATATGSTTSSDTQPVSGYLQLEGATLASNGTYYCVGNSTPDLSNVPYAGAIYSYASPAPGLVSTIPGVGSQHIYFRDVIAMPNGLVVCGYILDAGYSTGFIAKYDRATNAQLWFTTIPGVETFPTKLGIDAAGNFFASGEQLNALDTDTFFAKVSPNGTLLAQTSVFMPGTNEYVTDMCIVGGSTPAICGASGTNSDYYVATATADLAMTQAVTDPGFSAALAIAQDGTNFYASSSTGRTTKFNAVGQTFWTRDHAGIGIIYDLVCSGTSLYAAGKNGGFTDGQISKLNTANGDLVW
ncbi:MAG: hypothetical protein ABL949_09505 [Fimbriimonadaceae bacterium]